MGERKALSGRGIADRRHQSKMLLLDRTDDRSTTGVRKPERDRTVEHTTAQLRLRGEVAELDPLPDHAPQPCIERLRRSTGARAVSVLGYRALASLPAVRQLADQRCRGRGGVHLTESDLHAKVLLDLGQALAGAEQQVGSTGDGVASLGAPLAVLCD